MNTKILKLMNRYYTCELCVEKIKQIKDIFPKAFICADVIVGFPQETDEDFEITKNNIKKLPFSNLHIFPYSKRENTVAAAMDGQVSEKIKKERAKELKFIAEEKNKEFLESQVGKNLFVLVEKVTNKTAIGLSENYIETEILCENARISRNSVVKVLAKSVNKNKIIAELV